MLSKIDIAKLIDLAVQYGIRFGIAILILLVGWWLASRVANVSRKHMLRANVDATLATFLRNVLFGVLIALVVVVTLQQAGVPSASLVAAVGAAGLAIGLALRGSLANLAWGVVLIATRPFKVGDFVEMGGLTGTVVQVGLMQTWLKLLDNREACLPNKMVGNDAIINYNRHDTRRFEIKVSITYEGDISQAKDLIMQKLKADDRVLADPGPSIFSTSLDANSVRLSVRGWTATGEHWGTQTDFVQIIKETLSEAGIDMVIPQYEVVTHKGGTQQNR